MLRTAWMIISRHDRCIRPGPQGAVGVPLGREAGHFGGVGSTGLRGDVLGVAMAARRRRPCRSTRDLVRGWR